MAFSFRVVVFNLELNAKWSVTLTLLKRERSNVCKDDGAFCREHIPRKGREESADGLSEKVLEGKKLQVQEFDPRDLEITSTDRRLLILDLRYLRRSTQRRPEGSPWGKARRGSRRMKEQMERCGL